MRIISILGARPQFIKASMFEKALKASFKSVESIIVHTGQHYDPEMNDIFFHQLELHEPKYFLKINNLPHAAMTGRMMEEIERILKIENPHYIILYGDTNSTLAGAIAASKLNIKIVHIESGLRSNNLSMPEEINRIITDRLSDILFCPSKDAVLNLVREGFDKFPKQIYVVGDIMKDSAMYYSKMRTDIASIFTGNYILITIHREENTNNNLRLRHLIDMINELSLSFKIVMPLHPRTVKCLKNANLDISKNVNVIPAVGYVEMIALIKNSIIVLTDSGGLQKEAFYLKKFCITLRSESEWIELVESGVNFLEPRSKHELFDLVETLCKKSFPELKNIYGNGKTAENIVNTLFGDSL